MAAVDYLRDVCTQCLTVITMPSDGGPSKHLCIHDEIPWGDLVRDRVLTQSIAEFLPVILMNTIGDSLALFDADLDDVRRWAAAKGRPIDDDQVLADLRQTGPFEPGSPPVLRKVSDLLTWSATDLLAIGGIGLRTITKLQRWLVARGHELVARDERETLRMYLRARIEALLTLEPNAPVYPEDLHARASIESLRDMVHILECYREDPNDTPYDYRSAYPLEYMGIPATHVKAGERATLILDHAGFRVERLLIASHIASAFSIRINGGESVPASFFSHASFEDLINDIDFGSMPLRIEVRNITSVDHDFLATARCSRLAPEQPQQSAFPSPLHALPGPWPQQGWPWPVTPINAAYGKHPSSFGGLVPGRDWLGLMCTCGSGVLASMCMHRTSP